MTSRINATRVFAGLWARVALMALLLVGAGGWAMEAGAQSPADAVRSYDIPAGPLDEALHAFSRQSGTHFSYDPQLSQGKKSNAISGSYTIRQALAEMLAGTGLKAEDKGQGHIILAGDGQQKAVALPGMTVKDLQADPETHSINTETLRRTLAWDMADIFSTDSSVVIGGGGRFTQRLYLRGVEANNLNISIDGASQGRSLHQHMGDIGLMDTELLKRVEVQTGLRADAGPGALGGSIVFETADAQDLLLKDRQVGATVTGGYGSVDESWKGGASAYAVVGKHVGILAHYSGNDRQNYKVGDDGPEVPNSNGEGQAYLGKVSILDLNGHSLRFSAEGIKNEGLYIWGSTGSDMGYPADTSFDPDHIEIQRHTYTADYRFKPKNSLVDARLNIFYNENKVTNDTRATEYHSDKYGGDVRNTFAFKLGPTSHRLTLGADIRDETSTGQLSDGSEKENDTSNLGFYLQNRMSLGALGISFGARLDSYDINYGPNNFSGNEFSPNIGATYELLKGLTAFASYGEAVRASGVIPGSWMTSIDSSTPFNITEPETSNQVQGGLRYMGQGLLLGDDHLRLEGTYFNTRIENRIEAEGRRGVITELKNGDDLISEGFELRVAWGLPNFESRLSYTHVSLEDKDGNPVGVIRRVAGASGDHLVWDNRWQPIDQVTLGYTMNVVFRLTDVPDDEPERPGYVVHNIQAVYQPSQIPNLSLNLVVNNLFDLRYSEHTTIYSSTGIVEEPGLDVRLGFTYKF
ncbi:TonB-dependent receptor [Desulfocarbo indianensis]|nr:TonB-dependent receptor [Desulfocarbo indianensis]